MHFSKIYYTNCGGHIIKYFVRTLSSTSNQGALFIMTLNENEMGELINNAHT